MIQATSGRWATALNAGNRKRIFKELQNKAEWMTKWRLRDWRTGRKECRLAVGGPKWSCLGVPLSVSCGLLDTPVDGGSSPGNSSSSLQCGNQPCRNLRVNSTGGNIKTFRFISPYLITSTFSQVESEQQPENESNKSIETLEIWRLIV